ncbi:MAG: signal peptidase I [Gaiellaceae bacterium]
MRDLYAVLGVPRDSSGIEIAQAYRQLKRDTDGETPWGAQRLREVEHAYGVLGDPERRRTYDAELSVGLHPPQIRTLGAAGEALERPGSRSRDAHRSWNPVDRMTRGLPRPWRVTIDWIVTIVGAIAIVLAIKAWVVNPYRIPSSSMEPSLHCARPANGCIARFSDRVLANRGIYHFRKPRRGEIIVFKTPKLAEERCGAGGTFVKRLIALPGETWEERNGFVYINGKRLSEPYVKGPRRDTRTLPAQKIPKDGYFFMGDNRVQSCDSREWGAVPRENLIGEVFAVYWPPNRIGFR